MNVNFPVSRKIVGCHVASKVSYGVGMNYGAAWAQLFLNWDWTGWIRPQIDFAVGNGVGCNCIGLLGSFEGVFTGVYSQATYNAHWQQFVDYCAMLGVYVYFRAGWWPQISAASTDFNAGASTMTDQNVADGVNATLAALASRTNIIGIDLMNEANAWGSSGNESDPTTRLLSISAKVKGGGTTLPCTVSGYDLWTGSTSKTFVSGIVGGLDYLDFHPYSQAGWDDNNPIAATDFSYWRTTYPSMDILFGEFGSPQAKSYDTIVAFYESVLAAATQADSKVRGALSWAGTDGNTVDTDEWGLMDPTFTTPRLARQRPLRQYAGGHFTPFCAFGVNKLACTEAFNSPPWTQNAVTVTANATTAPDGNTAADKIIANSGFSESGNYVRQDVFMMPNTTYTKSVYAKASGLSDLALSYIDLAGSQHIAAFDLNAGTAGTITGSGTSAIAAAANGFYRCSFQYNSGIGNTSPAEEIGIGTGTGDGVNGVYLWGAQTQIGALSDYLAGPC